MIDNEYIEKILEKASAAEDEEIDAILEKAKETKGLTHLEAAKLLQIKDSETEKKLFKIAGEIKNRIYGKRTVLFAPLYISNYCINNCAYCGYRRDNKFDRRKLTKSEKREARTGLAFLSPWMIGFLLFYLLPMIASFAFSL